MCWVWFRKHKTHLHLYRLSTRRPINPSSWTTRTLHPTWPIPWILMTWRHNEPSMGGPDIRLVCPEYSGFMTTSSNGDNFRVTGPLCGEFTGDRWIPLTKQRPVTRSFEFSSICAWINVWVNNREAGDLKRHRTHYDITVMYFTEKGFIPIRIQGSETTVSSHQRDINTLCWIHLRVHSRRNRNSIWGFRLC